MIRNTVAPVLVLVIAAIAGTDRRIARTMHHHDALSPDKAIPPPRHWSPLWRWRLHRMENAGAIKRGGTDTVYLDPVGYHAYRSARRRRALIIVPIVVAIGIAIYFMAN